MHGDLLAEFGDLALSAVDSSPEHADLAQIGGEGIVQIAATTPSLTLRAAARRLNSRIWRPSLEGSVTALRWRFSPQLASSRRRSLGGRRRSPCHGLALIVRATKSVSNHLDDRAALGDSATAISTSAETGRSLAALDRPCAQPVDRRFQSPSVSVRASCSHHSRAGLSRSPHHRCRSAAMSASFPKRCVCRGTMTNRFSRDVSPILRCARLTSIPAKAGIQMHNEHWFVVRSRFRADDRKLESVTPFGPGRATPLNL